LLKEENIVEECPDHDFDSDDYFSLSAICKRQKIWDKVKEDDSSMPFTTIIENPQFFSEDMNGSFDHMLDTMPPGRVKLLHPEGAVAKVSFVPSSETKYTGMFRQAQHGIMRMSDAAVDPTG